MHKFHLDSGTVDTLRSMPLPFGYDGYGEYVFYRTYSRKYYFYPGEWLTKEQEDDAVASGTKSKQEIWADVVTRVINGIFSFRKDWYKTHKLAWDNDYWSAYASRMAVSFHKLEWSPPGRGCWAMGTDFAYQKGGMALSNCGYTVLGDTTRFADDIYWLMDALMCGVGVGFDPIEECFDLQPIDNSDYVNFPSVIEDSREGWCNSVRLLINDHIRGRGHKLRFDYSRIRPAGTPIRGFGGVCNGPKSLALLHEQINMFFYMLRTRPDYNVTMLKTDIANAVGCCVVSGNVRRSAELAVTDVGNSTFLDLKQYELERFAYRREIGHMSNNSARFAAREDFDKLGEIANRVAVRGEPGVINARNMPYGRIGKHDNVRADKADGFNPCAEMPQEDKEVCNIAETYPTRCESPGKWLQACDFAATYTQTVSLIPTHSEATNAVIARNRRVGVGIVDYTGWIQVEGVHAVTRHLRDGYAVVRETNKALADEAGVVESIRVTTVKPGGTMPKLAGRTAGAGYPTFKYTLRRTKDAIGGPTFNVLVAAGMPWEYDKQSPNTAVFAWPIIQGPAPPGTEVSVWQQAMNLVLLQREWSDNAVSNTLYFNPETESKQIEAVLSSIVPLIKSCSLLPHTPKGAYEQMPEEGITEEEYHKLKAALPVIDWSILTGSDGSDEKYCEGDSCQTK